MVCTSNSGIRTYEPKNASQIYTLLNNNNTASQHTYCLVRRGVEDFDANQNIAININRDMDGTNLVCAWISFE